MAYLRLPLMATQSILNKITLFLPDLSGGGAERVILFLAQKLVERGLVVHLVLARKKGELLSFIPKDVQLFSLCNDTPKRFDKISFPIQSAINLATYLRRNKPDALLSTITGTNLVAIVAKILARSSTHLVLREAATINNVNSKARLTLMRLLYPWADKVIALTEHMKSQLTSELNIPSSKVVCIPNPIDIDKIRLLAQEPLSCPWPDNDEPMFVGIGRLTAQKDFHTLINAFALLLAHQPAKLVILGDGPLRDELQQVILHRQLTDRVLLGGFDPNPYRWLNHAAAFVLTSRWEGHPNAILEALALSKPIVTTIYDPSVLDLLPHVPNMKTAPVGDTYALTRGMLEILSEAPTINRAFEFNSSMSISKYIDALDVAH